MTNATQPKTIPEVFALTPEALAEMDIKVLQELHNIVAAGTTKSARSKASQIQMIISGKQKQAKKAGKAAEPVANSTKSAPTVAKPNAGKVAASKTQQKPTPTAGKPAASPNKPAAPAKPVNSSAKPATPKPHAAKRPEEMTPEELVTYAKQLEQQVDRFPETIESAKSTFKRVPVESLTALCKMLSTYPYDVFCFLDERIDDALTQLLVVYAGDKCILAVDKSRQAETHLKIDPAAIKDSLWTIKEDKVTYTYPLAFYLRSKK